MWSKTITVNNTINIIISLYNNIINYFKRRGLSCGRKFLEEGEEEVRVGTVVVTNPGDGGED